jgi:hypothetical protein
VANSAPELLRAPGWRGARPGRMIRRRRTRHWRTKSRHQLRQRAREPTLPLERAAADQNFGWSPWTSTGSDGPWPPGHCSANVRVPGRRRAPQTRLKAPPRRQLSSAWWRRCESGRRRADGQPAAGPGPCGGRRVPGRRRCLGGCDADCPCSDRPVTSSEIAKSTVRIPCAGNFSRHRPDAEFGVGFVVDGRFGGMLPFDHLWGRWKVAAKPDVTQGFRGMYGTDG